MLNPYRGQPRYGRDIVLLMRDINALEDNVSLGVSAALDATGTLTVDATVDESVPSFVLSWGSVGTGNGEFSAPYGIGGDGTYIYVADFGNDRIQKFDESGNYQTQWSTDDQPETVLFYNSEVYVGGFTTEVTKNIYVYNTTGTLQRSWNTNSGQLTGGLAQLGNEIYAMEGDLKIHVYSTTGTHQRSWTPTISSGFQFIDAFGSEIYVVGGPEVEVYNSVGILQRSWTHSDTGTEYIGVAGHDTRVYVTASNDDNVDIYSTTGTFIDEFGSTGSGSGEFNVPWGIHEQNGFLFITDRQNNRVCKYEI